MRGRDSILLRLIAARRRTPAARRRARRGGRAGPRRRSRSSQAPVAVRSSAGCVATRASQTNRVSFSGVSSTRLQHLAAVELGGEAVAERRPGLVGLGDDPHRVGGAVGATRPRPRQPLAHEARALRACLRVRDHALDLLQRQLRRGRSGSAGSGARPRRRSCTSSVSNTSASRVALTEPSSEFSIGTSARSTRPSCDRHHAVVDRRLRHRLDAARVRRGEAAPLRRRCPRARGRRPAPAVSCAVSATAGAAPSGGADRLVLLGRELELRLAVAHALHVQAGLVAVQDRGHHDARAGVVEQRHRARLAAAHLAVGVVADHRGLADRCARARCSSLLEPLLRAARTSPRPAPAAARSRSRGSRACVTRSRSPLVAEHRRLGRAQPAQLDRTGRAPAAARAARRRRPPARRCRLSR